MKSVKTKKRNKYTQTIQPSKPTLFQKVACPVCSSKIFAVKYPGKFPENLSEEFLKQTYRSSSDQALFEQVVQCTKCETVYLNPRLKPDLIIDSYAEGEDESFIAQDAMRIRTFEKAIKRLAKQYAIPLQNETKILDVGCAGGAFLLAAENLGLSAVGIEPNRWMSEYAQSHYGLDVRAGTLSDYHFNDAEFDVITLWDVIEHVPQPGSELHDIARILKPGGLLIINYPDYRSFPARILGRKWPFWLSVHLTYYTPKTIRRHLSDIGFRVEAISPHWQTLELGYVLKRMTPYFSLARFPKAAAEKLGLAMLPITYWVGQTQVVARKVSEK
jgi:2-polyprenyl-3-methyl-5-hydroxy-6-metoxy-1,4-benzoquinol methylase